MRLPNGRCSYTVSCGARTKGPLGIRTPLYLMRKAIFEQNRKCPNTKIPFKLIVLVQNGHFRPKFLFLNRLTVGQGVYFNTDSYINYEKYLLTRYQMAAFYSTYMSGKSSLCLNTCPMLNIYLISFQTYLCKCLNSFYGVRQELRSFLTENDN